MDGRRAACHVCACRTRLLWMGQALGKKEDPCKSLLDAYVQCMHDHEGQVPDLYELEYCVEEAEVYKACRERLREERRKQASG